MGRNAPRIFVLNYFCFASDKSINLPKMAKKAKYVLWQATSENISHERRESGIVINA